MSADKFNSDPKREANEPQLNSSTEDSSSPWHKEMSSMPKEQLLAMAPPESAKGAKSKHETISAEKFVAERVAADATAGTPARVIHSPINLPGQIRPIDEKQIQPKTADGLTIDSVQSQGKIGNTHKFITTNYWTPRQPTSLLKQIDTLYYNLGEGVSDEGPKFSLKDATPEMGKNIRRTVISPSISPRGYLSEIESYPEKDLATGKFSVQSYWCVVSKQNGDILHSRNKIDRNEYGSQYHKDVSFYERTAEDPQTHQMVGQGLTRRIYYLGNTNKKLLDIEYQPDNDQPLSATAYDPTTQKKSAEITYSPEGNPALRKEFDPNSGRPLHAFEYNADEKIVKKIDYDFLGKGITSELSFDESGDTALTHTISGPGGLIAEKQFDATNNTMSVKLFDPSTPQVPGKAPIPKAILTYVINKNNECQIETVTTFNPNGTIASKANDRDGKLALIQDGKGKGLIDAQFFGKQGLAIPNFHVFIHHPKFLEAVKKLSP